MNEVLRDGYVKDNENGVSKWNTELQEQGIKDFKFKLPSRRFIAKSDVERGALRPRRQHDQRPPTGIAATATGCRVEDDRQ